MRGTGGKSKNANQPQRPQRAQRRTGERRPDWVPPSASSALSAVRFALSRALRRPGAMRGPCGKSKNADQPQRPRRAQSGTGEPCPHCCPPLRPQRSLRSDSPYHVRCGDPERCVGPAARARTQINRRGRRERRGEQGSVVLTGCPPLRPQRSPRSNLPYHAPCGDPERRVGPAAGTRTQINRRGRRERRGEQKRDVLIAAPLCVLSALPGSTRELENDGCRG
jgi:hypothetical protein